MMTTELCGTVGRGAGAHDESHRIESPSIVYRYTIAACTHTHLYTVRETYFSERAGRVQWGTLYTITIR